MRLDPDVVASAVTALTLTVAFGLLALGVEAFWVAFPVGFGGVLPLAVSLAATDESSGAASGTPDADEGTDVVDAGTDLVDPSEPGAPTAEPSETGAPMTDPRETGAPTNDSPNTKAALADLRGRYARGELTDEEFDRRLEELLAGEGTDEPWRRREPGARERELGDQNA